MNERQRLLVAYIRGLMEPSPLPRPADEMVLGVGPAITSPAPVPAKLTAASVQAMLVKQRQEGATSVIAASGQELVLGIEQTATEGRPVVGGVEPGVLAITDHLIEVAVAAMEKVTNDEEINPEEQSVLEAVVLPGKRPVVDIIDGDIGAVPPDWRFLTDYRPLIQQLLPSIGRIDVPGLMHVPYAGTGFFVGDGLLMTNRHVANLFVQGVGAGPKYLAFVAGLSAQFDPQYEVGDPESGAGSVRYEVIEPLLIHPHWDVAILRVRPADGVPLPPGLKLAQRQPAAFGGGAMPLVVVVGYPALDSRNNVAEQLRIFRNIFQRKRLMPGFLRGYGDIATGWQAVLHATTHDASTLGGNSGSAIIDLTSGLVLALHFGGRYLVANYGVPAWELAVDQHIVDLGVLFASPSTELAAGEVTRLKSVEQPAWMTTWDTLKPLATEMNVGSDRSSTAGPSSAESETPTLPVAPDWFEHTSDTALIEAMRRDQAATERLIRATLLPAEADDLVMDLQHGLERPAMASAEEGLLDFLTGGAKADPTLPEIIFLHGIMGGHLAAYGGLGGRVWLSPLALAAGGVAHRIMLDDDGVRDQIPGQILYPDGHVRLIYEKAARKWRIRGFVVHEWSYDWRKPIVHSADRLHFLIESLHLERPGKRFALVGHSMGGLVAALYAVRHPEWSARITQAIFLGSPLRGSYAPIEALLGTYPLFPKFALVDTRDELVDYITTARTMPGLLDMLPDPDLFPDAAQLYQRSTWPQAHAPAQIWLDQSRQLKRLLVSSPILETARLIVSPDHPTVAEVVISDGRLQTGRQNLPGDGTVPLRSAAASVDGVTVLRAHSEHSALPREDAVIDAVESLLKNGSCDLSMLSRHAIDDVTPIAEAVTETVSEAAAGEMAERLRLGIFTQSDADFLLSADRAMLEGAIG